MWTLHQDSKDKGNKDIFSLIPDSARCTMLILFMGVDI